MPEKHELTAKAAQLAQEIRAYSESQVHLWQQVPNLVLESDGRTGFLDSAIPCIEDGFWLITDGSGRTALSVDCATGRLVNYFGSKHRQTLFDASDDEVLWLATRLDELNVEAIIVRLYTKAQLERPSYYSEEEWKSTESRRSGYRNRLGLGYGKLFTRSQSSPFYVSV